MYEKITLPNGARIVTERIPYVRSAAVGIWIGAGSRLETPLENGACHFIEHLLFKGTERRTAMNLAEEMDAIGGQMNAFTTKECTCFYGRVLDTNLKKALDILFDMFLNAKLRDEDVESERGIIEEEIDMYEDTPEDLVTERLLEKIYTGGPLEKPILGTKESLAEMDGSFLREFRARTHTADRIVVALSGSFDDTDVDFIRLALEGLTPGQPAETAEAVYQPAYTVREKPIEQNHLCFAFPGLPIGHPDRYAMQLLSNILGGGMSSRLFQKVREENSLCYSIYSFGSGYRDTGVLGIYTALGADTEELALKLSAEVIEAFRRDGVTRAELSRAREQVKSNILMGLESTNARMNKIGKNELYLGKIPSTEETVAAYDAVTEADILTLARRVLDFDKLSFSAVGQVRDPETYRRMFPHGM